jgi:hypothetical protein
MYKSSGSSITGNLNKSSAQTMDTLLEDIPKVFKSMDEWIRKTDLHCWNCTLQFDSIPIPMPLYVTSAIVDGEEVQYAPIESFLFCTIICQEEYIESRGYKIAELSEKRNLLKWVFAKMSGYEYLSHIPRAFPRQALRIYGGTLTPAQYESLQRQIMEMILPKSLSVFIPQSDVDINLELYSKKYGLPLQRLSLPKEAYKVNGASHTTPASGK